VPATATSRTGRGTEGQEPRALSDGADGAVECFAELLLGDHDGGRSLKASLHEEPLDLLLTDLRREDFPIGRECQPFLVERLLECGSAPERLRAPLDLGGHRLLDRLLVHLDEGVLGGRLQHQHTVDPGIHDFAEDPFLAHRVRGEFLAAQLEALDLFLDLGEEHDRIADDGDHPVDDIGIDPRQLRRRGGSSDEQCDRGRPYRAS
jgi:hypothetical protein